MAKAKSKLDRAEWAKLPPDVQAMYAERNGQFVIDTDEADELRVAFDRTKDELAAAKRRLDAVRDYDPEEYQRLKDAADKASRDNEIAKGNYEKILAQDAEKHQAELKKRDDMNALLRAQLEEEKIDGELTRAISAYPGARTKLLLPAARPKVVLREIDGKLRPVVLDDKGEPRMKPNAKSPKELMEPAELIAEMRNDKEYAGAFPAASVTQRQPGEVSSSIDPRSSRMRAEVDSITQQVLSGSDKLT